MKAGEKVVCINDNNLYHIPVRSICEGIIYTLTEVFTCACGNVYVRLAEVNWEFNMWCPKCDASKSCTMYFHKERFRLLDHEEQAEERHVSKKEPVHVL